ncbi:hypothetical protein WME99_46860 [Sorangium sp. So ce136]
MRLRRDLIPGGAPDVSLTELRWALARRSAIDAGSARRPAGDP